MPKISVVIPTYNRRAQVLEAVASVRAQTVDVFEIVVVDDGSTDDTADHFKSQDGPVSYHRTENRGVSAARNFGVHMAKGEWIAFLDSDDEWHPEKLARQIACMENTGAVVCFTGCENEEGERLDDLAVMDPGLAETGSAAYPSSDDRFFLHPRHPYVQSALVERRALISAGLFDETLRVAEDTKLIYRLVMRHGYAALNDPLVKICRKRNTRGLSDDDDPAVAAVRYQCYARVQAEFYWPMLVRSAAAARVFRSNHGYFVSRWAELACILGEMSLARTLGREGLFSGGDLKTRIRSLLILISPAAFAILVRRKWRRK